jgi:hypothetical protein
LRGFANSANRMAAAIVDHFKENAEVTITISTSDNGLQRTPDPNDPATPTTAPAAPVQLSTKGTIA